MTPDECLLYFSFDIREVHTGALRRLRNGLAEMAGRDYARERAIRALDKELKRRKSLETQTRR